MATQKRYDLNFKIQALKLAKEIDINKAAEELGVAASTLNRWNMAARQGKIDLVRIPKLLKKLNMKISIYR